MPVSLVDPFAAGVLWDEQVDSDSGEVNFNSPSSQRKWLVTGPYDVNDLINSAPANIPTTNVRGGVTHFYRSYKYGPTSPTLGNSWLVVAEYFFAVDYFEISFDTSGGTARREQGFDAGVYYNCTTPGGEVVPGEIPAGQTVATPDFKGRIIDGVDVPDEKFDFTVLVRSKISGFPVSYFNTIRGLTGRANDRPVAINYKGQLFTFGQEELVYYGTPGKITSEDGYEFTLKFGAQRSVGIGDGHGGGVDNSPGSLTILAFTQPAVFGNVTVSVLNAGGFDAGDIVYVKDGGRYSVVSVDAGLDTLLLTNLGDASNAVPATIIATTAWVAFESDPLVIGNSGPIQKLGWRYLKVINKAVTIGAQRIEIPQYVIVSKVIRTADLSPLGIFS